MNVILIANCKVLLFFQNFAIPDNGRRLFFCPIIDKRGNRFHLRFRDISGDNGEVLFNSAAEVSFSGNNNFRSTRFYIVTVGNIIIRLLGQRCFRHSNLRNRAKITSCIFLRRYWRNCCFRNIHRQDLKLHRPGSLIAAYAFQDHIRGSCIYVILIANNIVFLFFQRFSAIFDNRYRNLRCSIIRIRGNLLHFYPRYISGNNGKIPFNRTDEISLPGNGNLCGSNFHIIAVGDIII